MEYKYAIIFVLLIAVIGMFSLIKPMPTGYVIHDDTPLIEKVNPPCFCASGENIEQQVAEQQTAYYSIVASAEDGLHRKQISEKTAIKVLNNYAEGSCAKCTD